MELLTPTQRETVCREIWQEAHALVNIVFEAASKKYHAGELLHDDEELFAIELMHRVTDLYTFIDEHLTKLLTEAREYEQKQFELQVERANLCLAALDHVFAVDPEAIASYLPKDLTGQATYEQTKEAVRQWESEVFAR